MPYKDKIKYKEYQKLYRSKNKKKIDLLHKEWVNRNIEKVKKNRHEWYLKHRVLSKRIKLTEEQKKINRQKAWQYWYGKNKEKKILDNREWIKNNKERRRISSYNYTKKRRLNNINYKIACSLRARLNCAIKSNQKNGSAINDLGCTIDELKIYLEKQFKEGMSWENWGLRTWHIDHKIPLSKFNLSNRNEFLKACHYTNLQPLWWKENLTKNDKII
jgi:hypothetical protein